MYLTYEEYSNMGGTVEETAFTHLEKKAEKVINKFTFNRIEYGIYNELFSQEEINTVRELVYQLIGFIENNDIANGEHKVVIGISNDGVSESYWAFASKEEYNSALESLVEDYLSDVYLETLPVLYRGADELPKVVERHDYSI